MSALPVAHVQPSAHGCMMDCWRLRSDFRFNPESHDGIAVGCVSTTDRIGCNCSSSMNGGSHVAHTHNGAGHGNRTLITHVFVVATRFSATSTGAAEHPAAAMVQRQIAAARRWLPLGRSALVIVDNNSSAEASGVLHSLCAAEPGLVIYSLNHDWALGYGYELGAWRWAVSRVLPDLAGLAHDAIVYLVQDGVNLSIFRSSAFKKRAHSTSQGSSTRWGGTKRW